MSVTPCARQCQWLKTGISGPSGIYADEWRNGKADGLL
ncbi:hypothetical protein M138_4624 [Bacteroides fragilis str. S23L17]|nr:hypothetical protein M138_4745 [Bacteroides fragilis str. S23L17]EYE41395.1 hypothetical protein M138_4624 [Bacteroides fragilis str. S23L17]